MRFGVPPVFVFVEQTSVCVLAGIIRSLRKTSTELDRLSRHPVFIAPLVQSLFQVRNEVFRVLKSNGNPYRAGAYVRAF